MKHSTLHPGSAGVLDERVEWRVVDGRKSTLDGVLQLRVVEWAHVPMALGLLMADFFYDNEERLYPSALHFRGGFLYLDVCAQAALHGWEAGALELDRLRALAERRRERYA